MSDHSISEEKVRTIRRVIYWKELNNQKSKKPKDDKEMTDVIIKIIKDYAGRKIG